MDESADRVINQYLHTAEVSDARVEWTANDPRASDTNIGFRLAWIEDAVTGRPCATFDTTEPLHWLLNTRCNSQCGDCASDSFCNGATAF